MTRFVCPCGRQWEIRQVGDFGEMTTPGQRRARRKAQRQRFNGYSLDVPAYVDQPTAPELQPGETLKLSTPMQGPSYEANVGVPLGEAVLYGTGAALVSIALPLAFSTTFPWYTPVIVWPIATGAAIFVTPERARKLLMRVEEWTGIDINQDGKIGPITEPIKVDFTKHQGVRPATKHLEIPCPVVGERQLALWFWRVCRQEGHGFSIRVGMSYNLTRGEVEDVQAYFIHVGQATHKGNLIEPSVEGLATMWGVVTRNFPDARLSPGDVKDT